MEAGGGGDKVAAAIRRREEVFQRRVTPGGVGTEEEKAALKFSCESVAASDIQHYPRLNLSKVPWKNNLTF